MVETLPVFDADERDRVHRLLALRVAHMMGRKLEEGDWTEAYCAAKGIPVRGWSNLDIDVVHENLGVEQKMLRYKNINIEEACGTTLMHPSMTRSIRITSTEPDPNVAMTSVFEQYAELVESRREQVAVQNQTKRQVDLRTGWLLWQDSLRQFLYFEEPMSVPSPHDYFAEWRSSGGGRRKASRNLWIFSKQSGEKRFSVTTEAGAKIQPYFDVPPPNDPNVYLFTVIGEHIDYGRVRVWIARRTAKELERLLGTLATDQVERAILVAAQELEAAGPSEPIDEIEEIQPVLLSEDAYAALASALPAVNDEHRFQLLLDHLRSRQG